MGTKKTTSLARLVRAAIAFGGLLNNSNGEPHAPLEQGPPDAEERKKFTDAGHELRMSAVEFEAAGEDYAGSVAVLEKVLEAFPDSDGIQWLDLPSGGISLEFADVALARVALHRLKTDLLPAEGSGYGDA